MEIASSDSLQQPLRAALKFSFYRWENWSSGRGWFKEHALGLVVDAGRTGPRACTLQGASLLCCRALRTLLLTSLSAAFCLWASGPLLPLSGQGCSRNICSSVSPSRKPRFPLPENSQRVIRWRGTAFTFRLNARWSFVEMGVWLKMRAQWLSSKNELMEKKQKSEILFKCFSLSLPFC